MRICLGLAALVPNKYRMISRATGRFLKYDP